MSLFDIRLWMYPGMSPDSDVSDWGPDVDISEYIRHPGSDGGQAISYSGGKGDEAPGVDAGQMTLTLDNRDGRFSTDNITGPYYGDLDLSTPVRLGVVSFTDTFTRVTASGWGTVDAALGKVWTTSGSASNWSTDGAKANVIISAANTATPVQATNADAKDVDVVLTVIPTAVATGARFACGIQARRSAATSYVVGALGFDLLGVMKLDISRWVAGVNTGLAGTITLASTYSAGQRWRLRMQADGGRVRLKVWLESDPEPETWDLSANETVASGTGVGLYLARFSGNTNSGVTTIMSVDDFTATAIEFVGAVVAWPLRWDITGNNSWAPITAAGILRRITQGTYPVLSPLRRQLAGTADVTGYWPMEEGSDSSAFSSVIPGQQPATFTGVTPAQDATLAGGGPAPTITTTTGSIMGRTVLPNDGTGMAAMFLVKISSLPGTKTRIARIRTSRGPCQIIDLSVDSTTYYTECMSYDSAGTLSVVSSASNLFPVDFTDWVAWEFETETGLSPGNTSWASLIHQVGETTYWAQTGTYPGTTNTLVSSAVLAGPVGTAFAHLWLGRNTLPFVDNNFSLVSSGYSGETASDRFARVCAEAGIPYLVRPGDSEAMGAQREGGTLAILRSCVEADYGVLSERGSGLEFIPRAARWNATAAMALTVAAGEIARTPEPTRDDQRLRNKWTVTRTDGGQGTAQDDDSVARHGTWEDSATINVENDTVLQNHAGWRAHIGSRGGLRWPSVALNFARNPTLLPAWFARGYGWRFTVTTGQDQVQGNEPDLIVEGFRAELWPDGWMVDLNCSSAAVWRAAVSDDTGILGRVDTDGCETSALITSTALSIPITTATGFPRWDNTAGLWTGGVDLYLGGERITVTSIANGVGQAQTLTASARGVGGFAFAWPSGTEVRLWDPAIVAL
jgi:hypothetical protein